MVIPQGVLQDSSSHSTKSELEQKAMLKQQYIPQIHGNKQLKPT